MFSTDKNIETISQLIKSLKDYIKLQKDLLQLNVVTKFARILTVLFLGVVFSLLLLLVIIFLSFAAVYALSTMMPTALAFLCIAGAYALLSVIIYYNRKNWIEGPLIRLFADILTS